MKSSLVDRILLFMSMVLLLSAALIGDWWLHRLIVYARSSFGGSDFLLLAHPIAYFVIAGLSVFLYWLVVQKSPPDRLIALLFIGMGFLVAFYNMLAFQFSSPGLNTISFIYPISTSNLHLMASAFIVAIGFVNLMRGRFNA